MNIQMMKQVCSFFLVINKNWLNKKFYLIICYFTETLKLDFYRLVNPNEDTFKIPPYSADQLMIVDQSFRFVVEDNLLFIVKDTCKHFIGLKMLYKKSESCL